MFKMFLKMNGDPLYLCIYFRIFFFEREGANRCRGEGWREGGWEGERESQAGPTLSAEPDAGLDPLTLGS